MLQANDDQSDGGRLPVTRLHAGNAGDEEMPAIVGVLRPSLRWWQRSLRCTGPWSSRGASASAYCAWAAFPTTSCIYSLMM